MNYFYLTIIQKNFTILRYIYIGELDLTNQSSEDILELLIASDELLLEELFKHIQDHLIKKNTYWIKENIILVLNTVSKLANCKELQYCCLESIFFKKNTDYMKKNFIPILNIVSNLVNGFPEDKAYDFDDETDEEMDMSYPDWSDKKSCLESICANLLPLITLNNFPSSDNDFLFELLKRDDLQVDEIDIWDCLIKWVIEQTPGLGSKNHDKTKWNQENFEALKKSLGQFIPLIRFVEISPADFYDKIRPYEAVIPHHIFKDVNDFYHKGTLPKIVNTLPRIASTIIKPRHVSLIANWIDRNDSNVHSFNNKYKFNLIYKKSRDGFDCKKFNEKCKGQPFVILIKVQSKKIYGGYNPIGYASRRRQWLTSSDSFIFSFKNDRDVHNMKIGRVINPKKSIYECYNWSFINFGSHLYFQKQDGPILYLNNFGNYNNIFDLDLHSEVCLPIEEIEVLSIVKR